MASPPTEVNPAKIARTLGAVAVLLVLASIGGQLSKYLLGHGNLYGLVKLFYVDAESNFPTLFSIFLLFGAALLLALIAILKEREGAPDLSKWRILAGGFLLMSVDEAVSLHERLVRPMRALLGDDAQLGIFYYAWVIPGIALVCVLALSFLGFLRRLPRETRLTFMIAGALYIGGAIGVELIGGRYEELHGDQSLTYSMIATVEESLEMAGIILFIRGLLNYLSANYQEVRFRLDDWKEFSRKL